MDRPLPVLKAAPAQTCVWMDAGVLAFHLCDRGFACEHCPLDAALRGEPDPSPRRAASAWHFPPDRLYAPAHTWVQTIREGWWRSGIDAFAARVLSEVRCVRGSTVCRVARGDPWCDLELDAGRILVRAPLSCEIRRWNPALERDPWLLNTDPYGAGWIAELEPDQPLEMESMRRCDEARTCAEQDARQFRRRVAFRLLSTEPSFESPGFAEAAERLVGASPFLELARELFS